MGDGCTITEEWCAKLEVTDLDVAQTSNENMAILFSRGNPNKTLLKRFDVERLPMYVVKYSSKQLVELLKKPLKSLLEFVFAFPREFLRGFFDAEGHVDVGIKRYLFLSVGAENSNRTLLHRVKWLLEAALNIGSRIQHKRKRGSTKVIRGQAFVMRRTSYSLILSGTENVRRFAARVSFSIRRKTQKLKDALLILATVVPRERPAAWKYLYYKKRGEWVRKECASPV
jgi:hypothetical protein